MAMKNPYNYTMPKGAIKFKNNINDKAMKTPTHANRSNKNKFDQYKEQEILTARPEELTLMLYNGIIKFLNQAKIFIEQKNIEKIHNAIVRAQAIITELNATLNMDYEVSSGLASLYDFMNRRLMEANINKDEKIVDEVLGIAQGMRDTWKEAMDLAAKGQGATTDK